MPNHVHLHSSLIGEEDIAYLQSILLDWYDEHGRVFPWRKDNLTEYELIVAEVLLQRTKADRISGFFSGFIAKFPNWQSLLDVPISDLEKSLVIIGLGSQKARRLKQLTQEMIRRKGVLPAQRADLEAIPFFGQYIANAVELLIFKKQAPLLDVNMSRVLERYFGPRRLADIRYDPYLQELAQRVVAHLQSKEVNWAILDFAALVCQALKPKCLQCPLNDNCAYFEKKLIQTSYNEP